VIAILVDDLPGQEEITRLRAALGPPEIAAANTSRMDGARVTLADLRANTDAMPFFGERRLVVVRRLVGQYEPRSGETAGGKTKERPAEREATLRDWLESLPTTTDLILLEEQVPTADSRNPLVRAIIAAGGAVRSSRPMSPDELVTWTLERAAAKGGSITPEAAGLLVDARGSDLRALDSELDKLLTYADGSEASVADVRALVSDDRQESVFVLVDSIGRRDRRASLRTLRGMLDSGANVQYLLTMIGRQVRLLLQVKAAAAVSPNNDAVASALKMRPWQTRNLLAQARLFSDAQLRRALALIVTTDRDIKTGLSTGEVALDLLVATLADADDRDRVRPAGRGPSPSHAPARN
jgi:DNA polymerase III delta subunit